MNSVEKTIQTLQAVARKQDRAKTEKQMRERLGIPETTVYEIRRLPDVPPIFRDREPRIKVSPYAKFDKYHHKKKRK